MKKMILGFGILLCVLFAYELYKTLSARANTEQLFSQYLSGPSMKIKASDLSKKQIDHLLSIQDPSFYVHKGVDGKTAGAGMTTVTQAVVKKLYFKKFKKGFAKIEQSLIARYAVDPLVTKQDQLAVFVNIVYWGKCNGRHIHGLTDASLCYTGKDLIDISELEYHGLITMLIAPNTYHPKQHPQIYARRLARVNKLLDGVCKPANYMDVTYENCD